MVRTWAREHFLLTLGRLVGSLLVGSLLAVNVQVPVSPEQPIPDLNILREVAGAVCMMPSVEARVEKAPVEIQTAMAQSAHESVRPEA